MVASEHPEVTEGRQQFIAEDVLDSEEAAEDFYIDNFGADSDEEDQSGLGKSGVSTVVTEVEKKYVEEVQQVVKYSSLSSYILKTPSLLIQGLKKNNKSQEKLFKHMCNFGEG